MYQTFTRLLPELPDDISLAVLVVVVLIAHST